MTNILERIKRGETDFKPADGTPNSLKEFQPFAKALAHASKDGLVEKCTFQMESLNGNRYYAGVYVTGGLSHKGENLLKNKIKSKRIVSNMFHLLVSFGDWSMDSDSMHIGRCFEYTNDDLLDIFKPGGSIALERLKEIPALLVSEIGGDGSQYARVCRITNAWTDGSDLHFEYLFESGIPQIANSKLQSLQRELGIESFEFSRTHWAIKSANLYKVLFKSHVANLPTPKVFNLDAVDGMDEDLVSVMMPFDRRFDDVHTALTNAATQCDMQCLRANDIWDHDAIIQDIVSLISRSRIVVCDCTGRNSNVFYEAGIAHCLGKDVILVSQQEADVPFDLRHLRYVQYLDNSEGRARLTDQVAARIRTLRQR